MAKRVQPIRQQVNRGPAVKYAIPAIVSDDEFRQAFKDHYESKISSDLLLGQFERIVSYIREHNGPVTDVWNQGITRWSYELFLVMLGNFRDKYNRSHEVR